MSNLGSDPKIVVHTPGFWRGLGAATIAVPLLASGAQVGLNLIQEKELMTGFFNFNDYVANPENISIADAGLMVFTLLAVLSAGRLMWPTMTGTRGHISSVKPRTIETRGEDVSVK